MLGEGLDRTNRGLGMINLESKVIKLIHTPSRLMEARLNSRPQGLVCLNRAASLRTKSRTL